MQARGDEVNRAGERNDMRGIDNGSGRKAAAGRSHHGDALPQLEVVYSGPELDDLSRSFEPRSERKSGLDLVLAGYNE
jgi:hypothetical protein